MCVLHIHKPLVVCTHREMSGIFSSILPAALNRVSRRSRSLKFYLDWPASELSGFTCLSPSSKAGVNRHRQLWIWTQVLGLQREHTYYWATLSVPHPSHVSLYFFYCFPSREFKASMASHCSVLLCRHGEWQNYMVHAAPPCSQEEPSPWAKYSTCSIPLPQWLLVNTAWSRWSPCTLGV